MCNTPFLSKRKDHLPRILWAQALDPVSFVPTTCFGQLWRQFQVCKDKQSTFPSIEWKQCDPYDTFAFLGLENIHFTTHCTNTDLESMSSVIAETIQQNYDLKEAGFVVFTIWWCPIWFPNVFCGKNKPVNFCGKSGFELNMQANRDDNSLKWSYKIICLLLMWVVGSVSNPPSLFIWLLRVRCFTPRIFALAHLSLKDKCTHNQKTCASLLAHLLLQNFSSGFC